MLFLLGLTGISTIFYLLNNKKNRVLSVIFIIFLFSFFAGMRSNIGDTSSYIGGYSSYTKTLIDSLRWLV